MAQPLGVILLSYLIDPFLVEWSTVAPTDPIRWHTNFWECRQIAQTFLNLGYSVDVISYLNRHFQPREKYAAVIDTRYNFERFLPYLDPDCVKIFHVDTANLTFSNHAEATRLLELQNRRGVTLLPRRMQPTSQAIEIADCATILGNEFTMSTYRYANKPLYRVPISSTVEMDLPEGKDFNAARRNFFWIGSSGLVHKGLDLMLEAFAQMPEFHLYIGGSIGGVTAESRQGAELLHETDFERAYHKELYETPNIHTLGWVDMSSEQFRAIARNCVGVTYASCSEGGGGRVIACMHAGLIPVVSYESSVDVEDFGFLFDSCSVEDIKRKIREVASLPAEDLKNRSLQTWQHVRANHTRDNFARVYRKTVEQIMRGRVADVSGRVGGFRDVPAGVATGSVA
jgi:glycosyltransferase involved in cell wall biosynthesis